MISEGNSALLPVNVDRRLPLQQRLMNFQLQNFHFGSASGNYEILGKQIINCFPWDQSLSVYYLLCLFMYMYMYDVQTKYFLHYNE